MARFGKWIGGGLGWAFGGPIGALLGFAIGTVFDKTVVGEAQFIDANGRKTELLRLLIGLKFLLLVVGWDLQMMKKGKR